MLSVVLVASWVSLLCLFLVWVLCLLVLGVLDIE